MDNNSTCYWKSDEITEKDGSNVPFLLSFLIIFAVISTFKIFVDRR